MTTYRVRVPRRRPVSKAQPCVVFSFELLPRADGDTAVEVRMRKALAIVDESIAKEKDLPKNLERRVVVTDRRVSSITPVKENGTLLFWELLDVVHLQAELAAHDVLARGALTIGDVAARADFAAGPGLFAAERLRDEVALVPRVVVAPSAMLEAESNPLLRASHHTPTEELGYIKNLLRLDADGLWFVDYLAVYCREAEDFRRYLEGHRRLVERRLGEAQTLDHESRAWTWLWSYHNRVVDDLRESELLNESDARSVRIPAKSPLVYMFPPAAGRDDG
jgi:hypothetical protein